MPTAKDRIQVLLEPNEYAEIVLLAKEERRSLASMAAVLINEAIKARIREGTFIPNPESEEYIAAKRRQVARSLGLSDQREEGIKDLADILNYEKTVVAKKVDKALRLPNDLRT